MQVAANTLAPYAAAAIGKNFGHGANKNETAQVLGHFLLGAALAYVNGADPLSGGSAAIASEKAAEYLAAQYNDGVSYNNEAGEFEPNRLPENVKQEIRAITGAIGALVGGVSGSARHGNGNAVDVLTNAQVGGVVGQNTVVNNDLAFSPDSDKNASTRFRRKISQELGGKFELVNTGRRTSLGYEIMELRPIGNYTIADLSLEQLRFYNMLNGVITDTKGTANIKLVYNDPKTSGGSWVTGNFDVGDMEKLDHNKIILSGNVLIAHEFYEQLEKSKLGLQPNNGKNDQNFQYAHTEALDRHEPKVLPNHVRHEFDNYIVNGVRYSKVYSDSENKQLIGINLGKFIQTNNGDEHIFNPVQTIINPDNRGTFMLKDPNTGASRRVQF